LRFSQYCITNGSGAFVWPSCAELGSGKIHPRKLYPAEIGTTHIEAAGSMFLAPSSDRNSSELDDIDMLGIA
jgi:hypothetical protein